jgi:hypothetical protein
MMLKKMIQDAFEQIGQIKSQLMAIAILSVLIVGSFFMMSVYLGESFKIFSRDTVTVGNLPVYIGIVSTIGFLFWAAAFAFCVFAWFNSSYLSPQREFKKFMLASAGFVFMLGSDDIFLFHDEIFPDYFGISEYIVYGTYMVLALVYLIRFRNFILNNTNFLLFLIAMAGFAGSILVDITEKKIIDMFLCEDGSKFVGIVSLAFYYANVMQLELRKNQSLLKPDSFS